MIWVGQRAEALPALAFQQRQDHDQIRRPSQQLPPDTAGTR